MLSCFSRVQLSETPWTVVLQAPLSVGFSRQKYWSEFPEPLREPCNQYRDLSMQCLGFPGGVSGKEPACQCKRHNRHRFDPWVGKIPLRRVWQSTPVFIPGESHGVRSLASYSPLGLKELDIIFTVPSLWTLVCVPYIQHISI